LANRARFGGEAGELRENPLWLEIVHDFRACQSRPVIRLLLLWSLRAV
jgi:hypothetical protein